MAAAQAPLEIIQEDAVRIGPIVPQGELLRRPAIPTTPGGGLQASWNRAGVPREST